jgi:hypothetical protein
VGKKTEKSQQQLGPVPAGSPVITGNGPLADAVRAHTQLAQLSQAHVTSMTPVRGVSPGDAPRHLPYQPGMPHNAATIELQTPSAHRSNSLYTDGNGNPPRVTVQVADGARAAGSFPGDVRAAPAGARGIGREPFHTADINPGLPEGITPQPAPGARGVLAGDRTPGPVPGHAPDVRPPGHEYSVRAPGDGYGPAGGYSDGRR